jgi:hypothetical protein
MRAKLALVLHLGGVGECGRLIWVWSVQTQGWMRTCTHIRNQGIYSNAQIRRKGRQTRAKNVGSILYYARAVDMMVLMALSSIAMEQTKAMERTLARCTQLLDYRAGHADAKVQYHTSDMIMNIHSDASYLSEVKARSRTCGIFFLGWVPKDGEPIRLKVVFQVSTSILRFVVTSTVEAELGALYHNCQTGIIF